MKAAVVSIQNEPRKDRHEAMPAIPTGKPLTKQCWRGGRRSTSWKDGQSGSITGQPRPRDERAASVRHRRNHAGRSRRCKPARSLLQLLAGAGVEAVDFMDNVAHPTFSRDLSRHAGRESR